MKALIHFFVLTLAISARAELPQNYQNLDAHDKLTTLWNNISEHPYEKLPGLTNRLLLQALGSKATLNLMASFQHESDEIPNGRIKFIHTYGSCGQVQLVTQENSYSGIFKTGALGVARLGWAAPPELAGYIPGMAVKFLIDGRPSVNIHVLNSLDGQGKNANYFAKIFTNRLQKPKNPILQTLAGLFTLSIASPFYLSVDHLASTDNHGYPVNNPSFPETLQFVPRHPDWISEDAKEDLREYLPKLRSGTVLYDVYGISGGEVQTIGSLKMTSKFVNSEYCDRHLFFQHHAANSANPPVEYLEEKATNN